MRSNNNNKLKAYVRFDGSGRVVPSSLIVQAFKPKVGNWKEIDAKECCNYTTTTTSTTSTPGAPGNYFIELFELIDGVCGSSPVNELDIYTEDSVTSGKWYTYTLSESEIYSVHVINEGSFGGPTWTLTNERNTCSI
jgi:hypothetical protein